MDRYYPCPFCKGNYYWQDIIDPELGGPIYSCDFCFSSNKPGFIKIGSKLHFESVKSKMNKALFHYIKSVYGEDPIFDIQEFWQLYTNIEVSLDNIYDFMAKMENL